MEITIPSVISLITLIVGYVSKYFGINSKYIPIQNIIIGVLSGVMVYYLSLNDSLFKSIVLCLISALSAGGLYDSLKKGEKDENEL